MNRENYASRNRFHAYRSAPSSSEWVCALYIPLLIAQQILLWLHLLGKFIINGNSKISYLGLIVGALSWDY